MKITLPSSSSLCSKSAMKSFPLLWHVWLAEKFQMFLSSLFTSYHFVFFAKVTRHWCNVAIPTSKRLCEFDIMVYNVASTFLLQHPWCAVRWINYPMLRWLRYKVVNLTFNIFVIKMLWIWRCDFSVEATLPIQPSIEHELNLLSNVEATLDQGCNFDVVALTSV